MKFFMCLQEDFGAALHIVRPKLSHLGGLSESNRNTSYSLKNLVAHSAVTTAYLVAGLAWSHL